MKIAQQVENEILDIFRQIFNFTVTQHFADSIPRQLGFAVTTYHPKSFENFKQIPKA